MAKQPNGTVTSPETSISAARTNDPLPTVKVNKANLGEIKGAIDEAVKKHLQTQSFTPSLLHPTVHLALGYSSVLIALGSALYTLRVSFEDSKPVLWIAVVGYFTLQGVLWAWKRWVEKGEVYRGKRRRMAKRIETDHIQIISSTTFSPPPQPIITHSPHTRPSSPSSPSTISPATLSPSSSSSTISHPFRDSSSSIATTISSSSSANAEDGPTYLIRLTLSTTSNNGKSLLAKSRVVSGRCVGEFVDVTGGVEEGEIGRWVGGLLGVVGLVGVESEGTKQE